MTRAKEAGSELVLRALDTLLARLTERGHVLTPADRHLYDQAVSRLGGRAPVRTGVAA